MYRKSGMLRKKKRRDTSVIRVDKKIKPRKNWGTLLKDSDRERLQNKVNQLLSY